jgi:hypothetical protein
VIPLTDFPEINPIHAFTITGNFPKFRVYPSTNVGALLATTYYDTQADGLTGQKHFVAWGITIAYAGNMLGSIVMERVWCREVYTRITSVHYI